MARNTISPALLSRWLGQEHLPTEQLVAKGRAVDRPERRGPVTRKALPMSSKDTGSRRRSSPPTAKAISFGSRAGSSLSASSAEIATGSSSTCPGRWTRSMTPHLVLACSAAWWTAATCAVPAESPVSITSWTSRGRSPERKARPCGIDRGTSRARIAIRSKSSGLGIRSTRRSSSIMPNRPRNTDRSPAITTRRPTAGPSRISVSTIPGIAPASVFSKVAMKLSHRSMSSTRYGKRSDGSVAARCSATDA